MGLREKQDKFAFIKREKFIKMNVRRGLCRQGCILKSKKFYKKTYDFLQKSDFLYSKCGNFYAFDDNLYFIKNFGSLNTREGKVNYFDKSHNMSERKNANIECNSSAIYKRKSSSIRKRKLSEIYKKSLGGNYKGSLNKSNGGYLGENSDGSLSKNYKSNSYDFYGNEPSIGYDGVADKINNNMHGVIPQNKMEKCKLYFIVKINNDIQKITLPEFVKHKGRLLFDSEKARFENNTLCNIKDNLRYTKDSLSNIKDSLRYKIEIDENFNVKIVVQNMNYSYKKCNDPIIVDISLYLSGAGQMKAENKCGNILETKGCVDYKLSCVGKFMRRCSWSFRVVGMQLPAKIVFRQQKLFYPRVIYDTLSRDCFTNYSRFSDVLNFCNQRQIHLKNAFFLRLFSSHDYKIYKSIMQNLYKLSPLNIEVVFIYKNITPKQNASVKFINYYSGKLHIFYYLFSNYSFKPKAQNLLDINKQIPLKKSKSMSLENESEQEVDVFAKEVAYDYMEDKKYYFLESKVINFDMQNYLNYRINKHSLILESQETKKVLNFTTAFKFKDCVIKLDSAPSFLVEANEKVEIDYLKASIKVASIKNGQNLFINFWEGTLNENEIYEKINESIELCKAVALVYHMDDTFLKTYTNLRSQVGDMVGQLILNFYLVKTADLGLNTQNIIINERTNIVKNLQQCYIKSQKSESPTDSIILYLHAKNLLKNRIFFDFSVQIREIYENLRKKLCDYIKSVEQCRTLDDILSILKPDYFSYEFLCDYLLEFKCGQFRFASEKCTFDNVFKLKSFSRSKTIYLKGKLLATIITNGLPLNKNLYLPYNLLMSDNIQIVD